MAVSKVIYDGNTLIDLTGDTVTVNALAEGTTAHDASGRQIVGTMPTDVVRYGTQELTDDQKAQARLNIGAAAEGASGGGTKIIMSETDPSNLSDGDYWDQILTVVEAPEDMFPYLVTMTNGTGYTLTATEGSKSRVPEGGTFSFTVAIANGYNGSNMSVKANGNVLTASNGVYTITNITANQTVTVEGVVANKIVVNITGTGNSTYCYATINGTKRYGAASNIEVNAGDTITFGVYGRSSTYPGWVKVNDTTMVNVTSQSTQTYNWTVPTGITTINISMAYTSTSSQRRGQITVTTA